MSGESPRVETHVTCPCGISGERPNQAAVGGVVAGRATTAAHASGQQSAACDAPRQQCLRGDME